jgi:hypothetical protein
MLAGLLRRYYTVFAILAYSNRNTCMYVTEFSSYRNGIELITCCLYYYFLNSSIRILSCSCSYFSYIHMTTGYPIQGVWLSEPVQYTVK